MDDVITTDDCEDLPPPPSSAPGGGKTTLELRGSVGDMLRVVEYGCRVAAVLDNWPEEGEGPSTHARRRLEK
jgi:hypothetical protein